MKLHACYRFFATSLLVASVFTVFLDSSVSAQRISTVLAERGAAGPGCRLTNMSVGVDGNSPINRSLPTYVITHGYNPAPAMFHLTNPEAFARKIRCRYGDQVNVLAFHWDSRGQGSPAANDVNASQAGCCLAEALLERGVVPARTTLLGHSMGGVVISSAANYLSRQTGECTRKLVMIDAPKRRLPMIFGKLDAVGCATEITNVWAGGLSGLGAPVTEGGVTNVRAPLRIRRIRCRGPLCVARNNHMDVVLWYYEHYL